MTPCSRQVAIRLWTFPTASAPTSVEQQCCAQHYEKALIGCVPQKLMFYGIPIRRDEFCRAEDAAMVPTGYGVIEGKLGAGEKSGPRNKSAPHPVYQYILNFAVPDFIVNLVDDRKEGINCWKNSMIKQLNAFSELKTPRMRRIKDSKSTSSSIALIQTSPLICR